MSEAKCLQISHNKFASQREAISPLYGNLMLSHSAGMQHFDISIAGISKRFHFASLHYIFSAYLPTHIKSLRDFFQSLLNYHRDNMYIISFDFGEGGGWDWGGGVERFGDVDAAVESDCAVYF